MDIDAPRRAAGPEALSVLLASVLLTLGACGGGAANRVATLEAEFDRFERLALRAYWNDDDCRYVAFLDRSYGRQGTEFCSMIDTPSPNRLNDESEAVIVELEETLRSAAIGITSLVIEPAPDGSVGTGSWFNVGACISYVYEPGWMRLPEPPTIEPGAAAAINADWYELDGCT